jgi:hypothetical protein
MKAAEFATAYYRNVPESNLQSDNAEIDLSSSRQWSLRFGEMLHDTLEGQHPSSAEFSDTINGYNSWYIGHFDRLAAAADNSGTEAGYSAANELNFHALNISMLSNWGALLIDGEPEWREARSGAIRLQQDILAARGLSYYVQREAAAGAGNNYQYFDEANKRGRGSFEGRANEFDAAIVLLEVMQRRKDLTVLPAPLQFEKFSHHTSSETRANIDFIVLRDDEQVAGIQVKGRVHADDFKKYDSNRVILVDAGNDLGNERSVKTGPRSRDIRLASWGGLICAQRVTRIKTVGKNSLAQYAVGDNRHLQSLAQRSILQKQFRAKQLTLGLKPYLQIGTERIAERLDAFFEQTA